MTAAAITRQYLFHGLTLKVTGPAPVTDAVHGRLRYFAESAADRSDLTFEFETLARGQPHRLSPPDAHGRPLAPGLIDGFELKYFDTTGCLYASYRDRVRMLCDSVASHVSMSIADPETENLWTAVHPMFVLALFELLKRRQYFNVHAAGLSLADRTVLVAGHSGAGKSTLAALLLRDGFDFLSDDYVFLTRRDGQLRVLAFPEALDMRPDAAGLLPELASAFGGAPPGGSVKRQIRVESFWDVRLRWEGTPAVIVFPTVIDAPESRFEPMAAADALAHLVANVQYTSADAAQAHVDLLGLLVRECNCYRLNTGRDLYDLPARIRALLTGSPAAR